MGDSAAIEKVVRAVLESRRFAVLATEGNGQPHASLMAIASTSDLRALVFGTYRDTTKYRNLERNGRVALLIDGRGDPDSSQGSPVVVTVLGEARELEGAARQEALQMLVARHPELAEFASSPACALMRVDVAAYQLARGVDDVQWWSIKAAAN